LFYDFYVSVFPGSYENLQGGNSDISGLTFSVSSSVPGSWKSLRYRGIWQILQSQAAVKGPKPQSSDFQGCHCPISAWKAATLQVFNCEYLNPSDFSESEDKMVGRISFSPQTLPSYQVWKDCLVFVAFLLHTPG
jgi:hypothetical protein